MASPGLLRSAWGWPLARSGCSQCGRARLFLSAGPSRRPGEPRRAAHRPLRPPPVLPATACSSSPFRPPGSPPRSPADGGSRGPGPAARAFAGPRTPARARTPSASRARRPRSPEPVVAAILRRCRSKAGPFFTPRLGSSGPYAQAYAQAQMPPLTPGRRAAPPVPGRCIFCSLGEDIFACARPSNLQVLTRSGAREVQRCLGSRAR